MIATNFNATVAIYFIRYYVQCQCTIRWYFMFYIMLLWLLFLICFYRLVFFLSFLSFLSLSMCSGRVGRSCSTSCICRVLLFINPVISHKWGRDLGVLTTGGPYPWSFVTHIWLYMVNGYIILANVKLSKWWFQVNQ